MEIAITLGINLACGLIGGYFNLTLRESQERKTHVFISAFAASFMVPLFLEIGQSNVMSKITDNNLDVVLEYKLFFIYSGFCLIAAISSKTFITSITNKVLKDVEETKNEIETTRVEQEAIKNLYLSDSEFQEEEGEEIITPALQQLQDPYLTNLLNQFKSRLKFQQVYRLKQELSVSESKIKSGLIELKSMGLIDSVTIGKREAWFLTLKGKKFINS